MKEQNTMEIECISPVLKFFGKEKILIALVAIVRWTP